MLELSIVLAHYNNWRCVAQHLEMRARLPIDLLLRTELIIVDDGSTEAQSPKLPPGTLLARVDDDIPWNQPGARNLGVHLAQAEWLLLSDIDHFFPEESLNSILAAELSPDYLYRMGRVRKDGSERKPHLNTFVIHKDGFHAIGGVDEDYCGSYGFDDSDFQWRWTKNEKQFGTIPGAYCLLRIGISDGESDSSLSRDSSRNAALFADRQAQDRCINNGARLRFAWRVIKDQRSC